MHAVEAKEKFSEANRLYKAGSYAAALALLEELRAAFPVEKNVLYAYILCLQALGQRDDALVAIGQLQVLGDPRSENLHANLMVHHPSKSKNNQLPKKRSLFLIVAVLTAFAIVAVVSAHLYQVFNSKRRNTQSTTDDKSSLQQYEIKGTSQSLDSPMSKEPPLLSAHDEWDTEKEAQRILNELEAGTNAPDFFQPQWQRLSYQPIIDAARNARLQGKQKTITVPGNITGKDVLRIIYSSELPQSKALTLGENEDIVYITNRFVIGKYGVHQLNSGSHVQIKPGTIVLFSAFHNDDVGGDMPIERRQELLDAMKIYKGQFTGSRDDLPENKLFHMDKDERYNSFMPMFFVYGGILEARGTLDKPIIFCSDSVSAQNSMLDWHGLHYDNGILDKGMCPAVDMCPMTLLVHIT